VSPTRNGAGSDALTRNSSAAFGAAALSATASPSPIRRTGQAARVEGLLRRRGEPLASMLLGAADAGLPRVPAPTLAPKSADVVEMLCAAFDDNGLLRHVPPSVRREHIIPHMRQAFYAEDEIIIEQYDPVDSVVLLTSGGAVSVRSDDVSMLHPCGSVVGDEELMPGMVADQRRFSVRARPALVGPTLRELVVARDQRTAKRRGTVAHTSTAAAANTVGRNMMPGVSVSRPKAPPPTAVHEATNSIADATLAHDACSGQLAQR
jgi:hypothetical protein